MRQGHRGVGRRLQPQRYIPAVTHTLVVVQRGEDLGQANPGFEAVAVALQRVAVALQCSQEVGRGVAPT